MQPWYDSGMKLLRLANAGLYRLEVWSNGLDFEWQVVVQKSGTIRFAGDGQTLSGAARSAASSVGLIKANWLTLIVD